MKNTHLTNIFVNTSYKLLISILFSSFFFTANLQANEGEALYKQQCVACHGINAEGNQALKAPKLAGQDSWYIENQLKSFRSGYRGSAQGDFLGAGMAAIAKGLKDQQINALANYVQTLKASPAGQGNVQGDQEKGKQFYQSLCGSCHGPGGKGNKALNSPKLAGLNDWYISEQLQKFRGNKRGFHQDDRLGRQMKMMSGILPDQQAINDVASYLSNQ
jgi:cytochrome c oxidase subunit 2